MSIRVSRSLALSLVVLAGAGCTDSAEKSNVAPFTRAVFDSERSLIPTPNDLLLQAAPGLDPTDPTEGPIRAGLFALIDLGGFVANPATPGIGQFSAINIPYELVTAGVGSTPALIDQATLSSATDGTGTVAIIRVTGADAPVVIPHVFIGNPVSAATGTGALQLLPVPGAYTPGARYVVALRGGPNGVKTADGDEIVASTPIALITDPTVDLDDPDSRPASLSEEQVADLKQLKLALTAPVNWGRATDAVCSAAYGLPPGTPWPDGRCWVPTGADFGVSAAFTAITELAFPVTEAISIQAFEIAP